MDWKNSQLIELNENIHRYGCFENALIWLKIITIIFIFILKYFQTLRNAARIKQTLFFLPLTIFHKSLFDTPSPMNTLAYNFSKEIVLHNHNLVIKIRKLTLIYDYCQILRSHSGFFTCPVSCIAEGTI